MMNLKSNLKIFIFLFSILLCDEESIKTASQCQKGLVQNFGLDALSFSRKSQMLMCPKVGQTCCKETAQEQIYSNWVISGDRDLLTDKFLFQFKTYNETLVILDKTFNQAQKLLKKMKHQPNNNCKVMAQKITEFNIPEVVENLENVLLDMYDFWYDTYEGIYCSICSTHDQFQFDFELEKIFFTNGFCRSIVLKNITFLVYYKYYMVDLMNLVHEFLGNCDYQGVYKEKKLSGKAFIKKDKYYPDLQRCYNELTKVKEQKDSEEESEEDRWFEFCSFLCEKFQINSFNEFFSPRLTNFIEFDILMNKYLRKLNSDDLEYQKMLKKTQYRLLSERKEQGVTEDKITDLSLRRKMLLPYVYYRSSKKANFFRHGLRDKIHSSQQNFVPHLEAFKLVYREDEEEDGIDLYFRGQHTLILKKVYDFTLAKQMTKNAPRKEDFIEVIEYKNQTIVLKYTFIVTLNILLSILFY